MLWEYAPLLLLWVHERGEAAPVGASRGSYTESASLLDLSVAPKLLKKEGREKAIWIMPQAPRSRIAIRPNTAMTRRKFSLTVAMRATLSWCICLVNPTQFDKTR